MEELKELLSPETIQKRVKELSETIEKDFLKEPLVLIGTLKGAFIFLSDLARKLKGKEVQIDFVRVKSYGLSDTSSGEVVITKDIELPIEGKNVIVVEDIVDTGLTLSFLLKHLSLHKPKALKVCALIDKKERRKVEVKVDYVGFTLERGFLVGYGLDYAEKYRHLPGIYEVIKR
ncbi:hypoxanthine phosphoribosyltransferase [Caldimicrobium thiodismutans]|uniref:Hypoxanthine phosphoribosyltransferase n=1 Tax=Caldimicrobium thiodismutans TaxID=1653476 RepID=A0A0U5AZ78_9BACT|nr:hypoxanthine phosphoribosyltransferase [Caldimicrobium thiodismutans]BAU23807.1 hypoxanthine phosphoribosyltransferase [Caldimicrobium thiodismutans]